MEPSQTRTTLDRWEGDKGVLEGIGPVPRELFPPDSQEGDVFLVTVTPEGMTLVRDEAARLEREKTIEALRGSLPQAAPPDGDEFEL